MIWKHVDTREMTFNNQNIELENMLAVKKSETPETK